MPDWAALLRIYMRNRALPPPAEGCEDAEGEA